MHIAKRLFRHLMTTRWTGRRAFPAHTLKAIQTAIGVGESRHRAEVRLIVEPSLELSTVLQGVSPRQRACELFAEHGVWDTEENSGILIYINLADHKVEIVADRLAQRVIEAQEWQAICHTMTQGYAGGAFHDSTIAALDQINDLLSVRLPGTDEGGNQLPNKPVLL